MGDGLFDQLASPELSEQLLALYHEHGVDVLLEEEVARFGGADALEYVEVKTGLCVEADIAVVGVGVVPNVDFLEASGVLLDNGVVKDLIAERAPADALARDLIAGWSP